MRQERSADGVRHVSPVFPADATKESGMKNVRSWQVFRL